MRRAAAAGALLVAAAGPAAGAPARSSPIAVVPGAGDRVYVANPDSHTVARLDFAGGAGALVWETPVGRYPRTVAVAGGAAYSADQAGDTVTRVDAETGAVVATLDLGAGCAPYGVAATPDARRIVVSCQGTSELVVLDPAPAVVARVGLAWPKARAIAVTGDGRTAYVTHFLTAEPSTEAHVSVVDLEAARATKVLAIPADTTTCETQNSGQGVLNLVSAIALVPDGAPGEVAGQLWVGGTLQNNVSKGLFERSALLGDRPGARMFPFTFAPFPAGGHRRDIYRAALHDIARFAIFKVDPASGAVVGKIDVDQAATASAIAFSPDGRVAYVVDHLTNGYHVFNTARGQGGNPTTVFGPVSANGPGGANPTVPCAPDEGRQPLADEAPFRLAPQARISVLRGYDPVDATGTAVRTGVEFDVAHYMTTGASRMLPGGVPDGVGTAPMGVALSPDGDTVYVANYLARNVVPVAAAAPVDATGRPEHFRCVQTDLARRCATDDDCGGGDCVPLVLGAPVESITGGIAMDPLPPALLDGKILFNTAARDASARNGVDLEVAAPLFNDPLAAGKLPGAAVSTARAASYVACTSCHADFGGHDGRTWDFSQFGVSLRNTIDLRGRPGFAPGTCSNDPARECFFDAACGDGNPAHGNRCRAAIVPPHVPEADRDRWFNPMLTVHWNGDRDEVEDFEHTLRMLQGAGDCDNFEEIRDTCTGALVQRSPLTSTDPVDVAPELGRPNRNLRGVVDPSKVVGVRLTHLADFVYSLTEFVRNPNPPTAAVERGRRLFDDPRVGCASCHAGGPGPGREFFTDKRPNPAFDPAQPARGDGNNPFVRHDVGTANVFDRTDPLEIASATQNHQNARIPIPGSRGVLGEYVTPVLNDVWNTPPYLHDGSAATLLDVVRPCHPALDDCARPGRGRNLCPPDGCRHGDTTVLTPRELNDLTAFLQALTLETVVGTGEAVVDAGRLDLRRVVLRFGKKRGRDAIRVSGKLEEAPASLDPRAAGVVVSLGAPRDGRMAVVEAVVAMRGSARRVRGTARVREGRIAVVLKRVGRRAWRLSVAGRKLDLSSLDVPARELMVAVEVGETAFVQNRALAGKRRVLKTAGRKRASAQRR